MAGRWTLIEMPTDRLRGAVLALTGAAPKLQRRLRDFGK